MAGSIKNFLNTVSTTINTVGTILDTGQRIASVFNGDFSNPLSIASSIRSGGLPLGAEGAVKVFNIGSWRANDTADWRVRLSVPPLPGFDSSNILAPLYESNNSMVWPLTPQVMINHSASYTNLSPAHSNYAYPVYQNSQIEDITITGDFPVENQADGRYWIAAVHFLRSATKMFYGANSSLRGTPPPILKLNGYGDFVFKDLPVVVKLFTMDLPNGVDYIKVPITGPVDSYSEISTTGNMAYVPTLSMMSVTLGVALSRDDTRQFGLDKFVRGDYITQGKFI
jgi:hypothetical protein